MIVVRNRIAVPLVVAILAGCADSRADSPVAERQTLPDGRVLVTYASEPRAREDTVIAAVRIGSLDDGGPETFGDVRGIEVGDDGTIYVLDAQASEIRAFTGDGSFIRVVAHRGEGPGEISRANGLRFDPDGVLWVNDHGKSALIGLSIEGREVARHAAIVPGFSYLWTGAIDDRGVIWEQWSHSLTPRTIDMSYTGPEESQNRVYFKSFDPLTEAYDSVEHGTGTYRGYRVSFQGGMMGMSIPFTPGRVAALDGEANIWTAVSDSYTLTRLNSVGDTTLVLQVVVPPMSVTERDLEVWRAGSEETFERFPIARSDVEALFPDRKPILALMTVDDRNRLWVGRTVEAGEAPLYDVYDSEGEYLTSVRLFQGSSAYLSPVVRGGRVYALVSGEYEEHYVLAGELPSRLQ